MGAGHQIRRLKLNRTTATHLDGSVFEDGRLPEAGLPQQGRLQQDGQSAPLRSSWVLHGDQSAGQAGARARTPDGAGRGHSGDRGSI